MSVEEILNKYKSDLKKNVVEKLELVSELKKKNYTLKHLLTSAILSCGYVILP
jgi:predicted Zn-ribbon and HTH transcriptional regulator